MIVFWAVMIIFAGHACTHMVAAGDTWVALACGRHFVNHGVDTVEPFSANSHKAGPSDYQLQKYPQWLRPVVKKILPTGWVNQNWLTHVIFYKFVRTFSKEGEYNYNGLVYWKFIVTFLAVVCTYYIGRTLGASPPMAAMAACFAIFAARSFVDIRPAVFSNLMVPLYLLILVLATYRNIRYIWLIVPLVVVWCNLHGGYIYAFMMLVPFVAIHFLTIPWPGTFVTIGFKGVVQTVAAGITALVAMIIFNPFHLTNLTHTFEISISKHAESWRSVNEWHSAFQWDNPVGDEGAFVIVFVLLWVSLGVWILARSLKPKVETRRRARQNIEVIQGDYSWPRIDLAYIMIALFTVWMAVRSRRFIPLGAIAACPLVALFFEQCGRMIAARVQYGRTQRLDMPTPPKQMRMAIVACFGLVAVFFGVVWGAKYKRVYLDPWPNDDVRDSVFMRMTASNLKPFEVMQFIRENKLSGNMFNHWTEGGAIAFGQTPDPETGRTPLQLFMDGRAQAAYNHDKFVLWQVIKSGGPTVRNARLAGRKLNSDDYKNIGVWIDAQMEQYDVWVILMPVNQINSDFMRGIMTNENWRTAFMDDYQMLLIDITDPRGETLYNDILNGKAKYPDEFTKDIAMAKNLLMLADPDRAKEGLNYAIKAFEVRQSQAPMQILVADAASRPPLRSAVEGYLGQYLGRFAASKDELSYEAGYLKKLVSAMIAAEYLSRSNSAQASAYRKAADGLRREQKVEDAKRYQNLADQHTQKAQDYTRMANAYLEEQRTIGLRGKW